MRGLINKRLETILSGMKQRCFNPKSKAYKWYGGRGITICREWLRSVDAFGAWAVSHGYADGLSIERKDNNGNYEPGNCCWIPRRDQHKNRRTPTRYRPYVRVLLSKAGPITLYELHPDAPQKVWVDAILAEHIRLYGSFSSSTLIETLTQKAA